jgi:hypothetical protein
MNIRKELMDQNTSSEVNSRKTSWRIPRLFLNQNVIYVFITAPHESNPKLHSLFL